MKFEAVWNHTIGYEKTVEMPLNKSFGEHNFPGDEKLCYIVSNLIIASCDGLRRKFTKIVALNLIILATVIKCKTSCVYNWKLEMQNINQKGSYSCYSTVVRNIMHT